MDGSRAGTRLERSARVGLVAVLVLCTVVSVGWLAVGAVVTAAQYLPSVATAVAAEAADGSAWARAVAEAAPYSEPLGQAVLDYAFSALNLVLAAILLTVGVRTWSIGLLAVALVGSAGAFNLQAHAAAQAVETATGLAVGGLHQVVLHSIACAAYILALLMFPAPLWFGPAGGRPARAVVALTGVVTLLLVGLGTALLPHTISCVLFFGFLVPVVGLVVLPRRVRHSPTGELRAQARLLFSVLVAGFAVALVLAIVTLLLALVGDPPGLTLVDPTAHGTAPGTGQPTALLFWFSRLASAGIAVAVLVATRRDGLWTAERWFSRGLATALVVVGVGGGYVVLRTVAGRVMEPWLAATIATVAAGLALAPLYVRAERLADRLLYGTRPTPYSALADVAALMRIATDAPDLARVAEAVARVLGAASCRLTVRRPGLRDRSYEWSDGSTAYGPDAMVEVPIHHGDERIGAVAVDRQAVAGLHAERHRLLEDIADGLGVVLQASRSGIELERQLRAALAHAEEIAVSRRRAVAEMDSERRRIERDLHDGAQHHLVSLGLGVGLVEHQTASGALDEARSYLGMLIEQIGMAEAVLAETVNGVSSLVLAEQGLVAALDAELAGAHPPVGVDAGGLVPDRRFPAEIESAVWFCCAESVGNARKHAAGAPVTVRLVESAGILTFTVRDEGPGFAVEAGRDGATGHGLSNLRTRIAAVGGTVAIRSAPGEGTTVEGSVPLPPEATPTPAPVPAAVPVPAAPAEPAPEPVPVPVDGEGTLIAQARDVSRQACAVYRGHPAQARVDDLARRLDEPLRIAVLGAADDERSELVEALIGAPAMPPRAQAGAPVPVWFTYGGERVESGPDAVVVTLPAPALRAMTLIDVPALDDAAPDAAALDAAALGSTDPAATDHVRALLGEPGGYPTADAFVLLLRYGRPADLRLLDLLHEAGHRGAVGVLARADDAAAVTGRAAQEYLRDPAVGRVCQAVVPVSVTTAVAAGRRLGDEEHRLLHRWAAAIEADLTEADLTEAGLGAAAEGAPAVFDSLGPAGARQALELVRRGKGSTPAALSAALAGRSGLTELRELIASLLVGRADALRIRSVLGGLEAVVRSSPPGGNGARQLLFQLERIRSGAHELREIELLDVLRSGDLPLPDDERRAAERLLGADGGDVRARLGLVSDATLEQMRAEAARQPARWRELAARPMASAGIREAAQLLIRTSERLVVEVGDPTVAPERRLHGSAL